MPDEQRRDAAPADDALVATQYFADAHGREEAKIRACSKSGSDADSFFVLAYPRYALPRGDVGLSEAFPRRLGFVDGPHGSRVLLHAAGGGAGKSYHHFLFYRRAVPTLLEAISAWGSSAWVTSNRGLPQDLPNFSGVPAGKTLVGSLVENLVSDKCTPCERQDVERVMVPGRLARTDARGRRDLLLSVATGVLLARRTGRRLVVNAEPGLVALLLYGAFRLLPEELVDGITFSTYEPRSVLTDSHRALVVGTFESAETPLDGREFGGGAYSVDTVALRLPSELRRETPKGLEWLANAVIKGKWGDVRAAHELCRLDGEPDASSLSRAVACCTEIFRAELEEGVAAALDRRADPMLQRAFEENVPAAMKARDWLIRAATRSKRSGEMRQAFLRVLRTKKFLEHLRTEAASRLYKDKRDWVVPWRLLRHLSPSEKHAAWFADVLGRQYVDEMGDRSKREVLCEWAALGDVPERIPPEFLGLLSFESPRITRAVLDSTIPAVWKAQVLGRSFDSAWHDDVRALLVDGDEACAEAFCDAFALVEVSAVDRFKVHTLAEVAEEFQLPLKTVKRWHSSRKQPLPGEQGSFDLYEIVRWAEVRSPTDEVEMPDWAKVRQEFEREADRLKLGEYVLALVDFHPHDAAAMLSRLRRHRVDFAIPREKLDNVLAEAGIAQAHAPVDELEQLRLFTDLLPPEGRSLPALWKRPLDRLDKQLLLGNAEQKRLFAALYSLARENKGSVPASADHELNVWKELLSGSVERPQPPQRPDHQVPWPSPRVAAGAFVLGAVLGGLSYGLWTFVSPEPSPPRDEESRVTAANVVSGGK